MVPCRRRVLRHFSWCWCWFLGVSCSIFGQAQAWNTAEVSSIGRSLQSAHQCWYFPVKIRPWYFRQSSSHSRLLKDFTKLTLTLRIFDLVEVGHIDPRRHARFAI